MGILNGSLDGIVSELTDLLGRAEWTAQQAQEALDAANAEVKRIKAILKAAGFQEEEPRPKSKKVKSTKVNEETRASVLNAIHLWVDLGRPALPDVPGSFTAMDLEEYTPCHSSSIRNAINNLRDEGIVRAVGLKSGTPRRAPMVYALGEGNEASE